VFELRPWMNSSPNFGSPLLSLVPTSERPRERCLEKGAFTLSLRECLAVILGSGPRGTGSLGLASRILARPGDGMTPTDEERAFFGAMENSGTAGLLGIDGLGPAGRARLMAAFELGRRYANFRLAPTRGLPEALADLASEALDCVDSVHRNEPREWLGFVCLLRTGALSGLCVVERGVRTHVNIDPAELFARLLALRPRGFFLVHNHPSGNLSPSREDFHLTRTIDEIASGLGLQLMGHWIVAPRGERWIPSKNPVKLT
jgi:DNA repair protein RadC